MSPDRTEPAFDGHSGGNIALAPVRSGDGRGEEWSEEKGHSSATVPLPSEESRMATILELSGTGIWRLGVDTGESFLSARAMELLGLPRGSIVSLDVFLGQLCEEDRATLADLLCNPLTRAFSLNVRPEAVTRGVELLGLRGCVRRDETGNPIEIVGTVEDLSERDREEQRQRAQGERTQALFEYAPDGIVVTNLSGTFLDANPSACRMLGYTREELTSLRLSDVVPGPEAARLGHALNAIRDCTYRSQEWQCRRKDGSVFAAEVFAIAMPDGHIMATIRDITERRLAEAAIVRSTAEAERINRELSFQKFALDQHAIVAITDRSGVITYVNDKFCEISGYTPEELIGQDHRIINSGYHSKAFFKELYGTVSGGRVWRGEIRNRAKDGRIYWVDTTIVPYRDESARVVGYVAIRADITARKLAEEEIERVNAQLTEQNQRLLALTEQAHCFVDDVSHEFRTPLAVIKEFGSLISDGLAGPVSAQQAQFLDIIDNAVIDLNQMVEDFLDSSKLRAGRLRVDRRPYAIEDIFARARPGLQKKATGRSITIVERIDPALPRVFVDEEKVRRVIMNLATNAIKFSPEGSRVELWARGLSDGGVEVGVTDQGRGLTPEDLRELFGRFRQLPSVDGPSVKGFGLGLNIARRLVWLNLGSIGVISQLGKGSTFSFTVPGNDVRLIVERFFARLAECEVEAGAVAVLSVTPLDPRESQDSLRLFLAAATRPTDVILETPGTPARGFLLLGPTESAEGWASRLQRIRTRALADNKDSELGPLQIETVGVFRYPAESAEAATCALRRLTMEGADV